MTEGIKDILVRYCPIWEGYPEAAVAAQEELKKEFPNWNITIKKGDKGEFTVNENQRSVFNISGEMSIIYDKAKTGRFPCSNELLKIFKE